MSTYNNKIDNLSGTDRHPIFPDFIKDTRENTIKNSEMNFLYVMSVMVNYTTAI